MSKEQWLLKQLQARLQAVKEARAAEKVMSDFVRESITKAMVAQLIAETEYALRTAADD